MEGVFYVWVLIKFIKKGINFVKNIFCNLSIVLVIMKLFIFLGDCFVIFCLDNKFLYNYVLFKLFVYFVLMFMDLYIF